MCNELKEAKFGVLKWLDITTEDNHQAIQIDDETGRTYRWDWEESFDRARNEAVEKIADFQSHIVLIALESMIIFVVSLFKENKVDVYA